MVMSVDLFNPLQHVQRSKHNLNDVLYAANHNRVYICMCVYMCIYMCVCDEWKKKTTKNAL